MAVSGTLAVRVHRIETPPGDGGEANAKYSVKLAVGADERRTAYQSVDQSVDETLHYRVQHTAPSEEVTIEVLQENQTKPLVSAKQPLSEYLGGFKERKMTFTFGPKTSPKTLLLFFSAEWTEAETQETALATETHRPWFMRASYYYEASKSVYDYTTSFRVVKPFARLGEATVNTVLATVAGKTLHDVDQSLVVPVLGSVDNRVDGAISVAFTKLYEGQKLALKTKDKAVGAASAVARSTGNAVTATARTAGRATRYATNRVHDASSAVYNGVTGAADYVGSQVVHASSSTYGMVRGVTYSVASYIPILGPKIRA